MNREMTQSDIKIDLFPPLEEHPNKLAANLMKVKEEDLQI